MELCKTRTHTHIRAQLRLRSMPTVISVLSPCVSPPLDRLVGTPARSSHRRRLLFDVPFCGISSVVHSLRVCALIVLNASHRRSRISMHLRTDHDNTELLSAHEYPSVCDARIVNRHGRLFTSGNCISPSRARTPQHNHSIVH